jgi:hypothetical protein
MTPADPCRAFQRAFGSILAFLHDTNLSLRAPIFELADGKFCLIHA